MGIISWLILGAIAGWIASLIAGTDARQGWLLNIVVGVVGAFIGGWLASLLGMSGVSGFNLGSILIAIVGAVILLFVYNALTGRRSIQP